MTRTVYQDAAVQLVQGHVLDALGALADASVQTVVTSPPYWGLRDYQIPPQVWGGDPAGRHEWGDEGRSSQRNRSGAAGGLHEGRDTNKLAENTMLHPSTGAFCSCGAWRGSLGLEPTPELYVEHLVGIFAEVWRVLREDGTLWLNLGDCYAGSWSGNAMRPKGGSQRPGGPGFQPLDARYIPRSGATPQGLKPKDLVGIPWRVAFALQAWGWWLRMDIVWAKGLSFCPVYAGSIMPESVGDRPTRAHEYVFLLTKAADYFADFAAIRERALAADEARWDPGLDGHGGGRSHAGSGASTRRFAWPRPSGWNAGATELDLVGRFRPLDGGRRGGRRAPDAPALSRNVRSVWAINPQPFPEAHFATFPEDLVKPCVLVGTSARGACPTCAAPWERVTVTGYRNDTTRSGRPAEGNHVKGGEDQGVRTFAAGVRTRRVDTTTGWRPTCACYDDRYRAEFPQPRRARPRAQRVATGAWWRRVRARPGRTTWPTVPCVVADPFAGAGTVLLVAKELGRHAIGSELSPAYCGLTVKRLRQEVLPFGASG